jgi:adenine-specific DNA-methyltransferase
MSETGFLFISIDENEFAHLKLLCDQLFGEKNFVNYLVWKKRSTGGQVRDGSIITQTEFVFIYAKNKAKGKLNKLPNGAISESRVDSGNNVTDLSNIFHSIGMKLLGNYY